MPVISGGNIIGGISGLSIAEATYSFAVNGGAVSNITLTQGDVIPQGAIILGGVLEVTTAVTSDGAASVGITVETTGDIVASAAVAGAPWSTTGRKSVVPVFTGATSVKTTAARSLVANVTTSTLTAGVFNVHLVYYIP